MAKYDNENENEKSNHENVDYLSKYDNDNDNEKCESPAIACHWIKRHAVTVTDLMLSPSAALCAL